MHTPCVEKETKHTVIAVVAIFAVFVAVFVGIFVASGVTPPQTIVESESMQHGRNSQIGIIDTADMIILKSKDNVEIRSYVDGYNTGYMAFGSYGDVIIYDRGPNSNAVIHRAILWLDYNGDGTWSAPSLKDYPSDLWSNVIPPAKTGDPSIINTDYMRMSGTLILYGMRYTGESSPTLNLDTLVKEGYTQSGYITMGDFNYVFDQPSSVAGVYGLISYEKIKAVAWFEVPWVGAVKMILNHQIGAVNTFVPNTIPCLTAAAMLFIFIIVGISFLFDQRYYRKHRKELYKDMNAPTP